MYKCRGALIKDQVVMCSNEDREVTGSNPTLAEREFLWVQEMNSLGSTQPMCELVP